RRDPVALQQHPPRRYSDTAALGRGVGAAFFPVAPATIAGTRESSCTSGTAAPRAVIPEARDATSVMIGISTSSFGCRRCEGPPIAIAATTFPFAPMMGAAIAADSGNISPM